MAGYCTLVLYFHSPVARENTDAQECNMQPYCLLSHQIIYMYVCVNICPSGCSMNVLPLSSDQSDADLHTALMHMITVTVGCPSHSTHLWYHMFNIEELKDNYITGFLVSEHPL